MAKRTRKRPRAPAPQQRSRAKDDIDEGSLRDPERLEIAEVFAEEHHEPRARIGDGGPLVENQWYESLETSPVESPRESTKSDEEDLADLLDELSKAKQEPDSI